MVSKNIIDKIQKLLALGGNNPNENEATNATRMAMDLLAKYNLSMSEITDVDTEVVTHEDFKPGGKSFPTWKTILLNAICKSHFCKVILRTGTGSYIIIGKETNRETAKMMFSYLCNVIDFETKQYLKDKDYDRSIGKTQGNAFRVGMAKRLEQRFNEKQQEIIRESQENALVRIDPYSLSVRENDSYTYKNFRTSRGKQMSYNPYASAYGAGFNAGGKVGLHGSRAITA
jgi:hypothetical protein